MIQGWSQVSQTSSSQIPSAPTPHKIFESLCFFSVCQLQGFFDEYFVVKSQFRDQKHLVEFNDVSKTALKSKIRTPWAEILAFFWDKVRRNYIFNNRGFQSKNLLKVWTFLESLHCTLSEK